MKWDIATVLFLCLTWPGLTQAQAAEPTEDDGWLRSPDGQVSVRFINQPEPAPPYERRSLIDPSEPALPPFEENSPVALRVPQTAGRNQNKKLGNKSEKKSDQ
jgi:hypothetical protein